jgi:histidine triad (HIT) family protein
MNGRAPVSGVNSAVMACLFCDIATGKVASKKVYEDDALFAFHDINPQAPTHILVIPKRHITAITDVAAGDDGLVGSMARRATELAKASGLDERGFRLVFNCGPDAGYSVFHIHLHLLGGRVLGWPPG